MLFRGILLTIVFFGISFAVMPVFAYEKVVGTEAERISDNTYIFADKVRAKGTYEKDLFIFANNVEVTGEVQGDLFVIGTKQFVLTGIVRGNVWFFANQADLQGNIVGSVRGAGPSLLVDSIVEKNLQIFGNNVRTSSQVGWHSVISGNYVEVGGSHHRTDITGREVKLTGNFQDDVYVRTPYRQSQLTVNSESVIQGTLHYHGEHPADIEPGAQLPQDIDWQPLLIKSFTRHSFGEIFSWLTSLFGLLVVGLLVFSVIPDSAVYVVKKFNEKPGVHLLIGFISLFLIPIVVVLLLFTVIGIPLAILVTIMYGVILYVSQIFASVYVGQLLVVRICKGTGTLKRFLSRDFWSFTLGLIVLKLIIALPLIGWIFSLLVICSSLGTMVMLVRQQIKSQ